MNHGIPTFEQIAAVSRFGLGRVLTALDFPRMKLPTVPANGQVTAGVKRNMGGLRTVCAALTGDGTTTAFTVTHSLGAQPQDVRAFTVAGGAPGVGVRPAWTPGPADSLNQVVIGFAVAPAAGDSYFVIALA